MKKVLSFFALPLCLGLGLLSNAFAKASTDVGSISSANIVSCYDVITHGGFTSVYDCGDCEQEDDAVAWSGKRNCNTSSY